MTTDEHARELEAHADTFEVEYPDGTLTCEIHGDNVVEFPAAESKPFEFLFDEGEQLTIESAVYQAIGAASTCFVSGVFDTDRAKAIADELLAAITALCEAVRQGAAAGSAN